MAYSAADALRRWSSQRTEAIATLAAAHAAMGEVDGPGRPLEIGRTVADAYILRVVAEFQGFTRYLHDLAAEMLVELAQPMKVGDDVLVPWGLDADVPGKIVEVWGDPPAHVRVQLALAYDEEEEPVVLLLSPDVVNAA